MLEPSQVEKWVKDRMKENPFMTLIGAKMDEVKCGFAQLSIEIDPKKHANRYGAVHGGVMFAMADTAMGALCYSLGAQFVTLSATINFIKNTMQNDTFIARATPIHRGRSTIIGKVQVFNHENVLMADLMVTMFVTGIFDEIPKKW